VETARSTTSRPQQPDPYRASERARPIQLCNEAAAAAAGDAKPLLQATDGSSDDDDWP